LQRKIGLALGSGSARGWAHIGVIKALDEAGIRLDYVAGTSAGAVVGAVYASGRIESFKDVVLQLDWKRVVSYLDVVFPKTGLIDGNKIADFLRANVEKKNIEDLHLPFCAVSTELATGKEVAIQNGDIIEAVRASISTPGIFTPVKRNDAVLVDGGLVNPVPVSVVRKMGADLVIAVNLNHGIVEKRRSRKTHKPTRSVCTSGAGTAHDSNKGGGIQEALHKRFDILDIPALKHLRQRISREPMPNIFEIIIDSINIMEAQITAARLKTDPPDLLIQPDLGHIRFLEFNRAQETIAAGYEATKRCLKNLP
jgi:NTE family protein